MRLNRINDMEQYIIQHRAVSLEDLAEKYGISMNTVRRDVAELLLRGNVRKVYGGVSTLDEAAPSSINDRLHRSINEKMAIGALAATLIPDHSTVYIDTGSTTMQIIPHLAGKTSITLVTTSLDALIEARKFDDFNIILLGGLYNHSTGSTVGGSIIEMLSQMRIDYVLVATTGISVEHGVTNSTYAEVEIKRHVAHNGGQKILMADSSKFGRAALMKFCEVDELAAIVTDRTPDAHFTEYCRQKSVRILSANK